ncbi:uncharacterized protein PAN0_010d3982 [Moesziomyces antarcticus]|uniref:Uncharacterized protein n=2 Tax=Pseudozyma antarctica TaxID=84753 RepID=A0A5C3FME2_PSEA2|nr:uncharacterized protein PAN0_010d3982 [Moesziomyces antarcticus]GAK65762.1 conserved hypothetical protein [Moesziomyces antarcticus]SPO45390.1 uncharacterized protein PSANT_03076 [Moesziomyces antarcticus]
MFKRVAKATGRKGDVDELKLATGDDTAIGVDKLIDESSSSEGEDDDSEEEDDEKDGSEDSEGEASGEEAKLKAGSKRKRVEDDEADAADAAKAEAAAVQVSIREAMQDPIYVPTEGEKKHGVLASRCIVCEAAVLKTPHLVAEHLEGKGHKRRFERFQSFVQEQLSEGQRKNLDARDAVDQMDAWKTEQDALAKQKLADAPPSKSKLAKKKKAAEFRKMKKEAAHKRRLKKKADKKEKKDLKSTSQAKKTGTDASPEKKGENASPAKKAKTAYADKRAKKKA